MYLVTDITTFYKIDLDRFMGIAKRERFVVKGEYVHAQPHEIDRACTAEIWKQFWDNPVVAHFKGKGIDIQLNLKIDHVGSVRTVKYILFINGTAVHYWTLEQFLQDKVLVLPGDKYPPALVKYFGNQVREDGTIRKQLFVILAPNDVVFAESFGYGPAHE